MCGIAGFASRARSNSKETLDRAIAAIAHRGPDGSGRFSDRGVHLAHCRLAIIDLRDVANQPMLSDDGSLAIVFNGEIYNYIELRDSLEREGVAFRTTSDTEVILKYYERYMEDCTNKFNGMWSFVIYDSIRRVLFASRDRFGEKPFFYRFAGHEFYFASEIKALIAMGVDSKLDIKYLKDFFYWERCERSDHCNFKDMDQLPGAHSLLFDIEEQTIKIWKYYKLEQSLPDLTGVRFEDACLEFQARLKEAVRIRNRADVPVGLALSGGIDSSLIATELRDLVRENCIRRPLTINAAAGKKDLSEADQARATAQTLGLPFVQVPARVDDLMDTILKAHWHQEAPATTMSVIMSWNVYRQFRKEQISVVLDGQGGDELLLGYPRYVAIPIFELLSEANISGAAKLLWQIASHSEDLTLARALAFCFWGWFNWPKQVNRFLRSTISVDAETVFREPRDAHFPLRRRIPSQVDEIQRWTLPCLLRTADRNSMAHAVEVRLPYLDPNVVEYAVSLPTTVKYEGGYTKAPSRHLLSLHGLENIATARRKLSFQAADQQWLAELGLIPFDYVSRSQAIAALNRQKMTNARFQKLPFHEQWKFFSVAIIESQYGVTY